MALGYLSGKASSRLLDTDANVPILFLTAVIPDADMLFPFIAHRGPTHSLITLGILSIPFLLIYGKRAVPYVIALAQHPLFGDFLFGGGVQLLWPITIRRYGLWIGMGSQANILLEWAFFIAFLFTIFKTRDAYALFQRHQSNLILLIPLATVFLPPFFGFPTSIPSLLIIPHLVLLILLAASISSELGKGGTKGREVKERSESERKESEMK